MDLKQIVAVLRSAGIDANEIVKTYGGNDDTI